MGRDPIPTWFFVLVAVKKEDRYLLVHERKHGQLWYFPAGRVEAGEDFIQAAKRETLEESGVPIEVTGVIRMEHSPTPRGTRLRLIVSAEPVDNTPPKSVPDEDTLEAGWFTLDEMKELSLRSADVLQVFSYLERGGAIAPPSILTREGAAFV